MTPHPTAPIRWPAPPRRFDADMAAAMTAAPTRRTGLAGLLRIRTVAVTPGRLVCEVDPRPELTDPFTGHGGLVTVLIDHALAIVVYPHIERGRRAISTSIAIELHAAADRDGTITAEAVLASQTGATAVVDVEVTQRSRILAHGRGTVATPEHDRNDHP